MNTDRFERQIRLFGNEGQEHIRRTNVAIVGAGGLGSHVTQQLAFLGVGNITIIDADKVEASNLNRLIGASHEDLESNKDKVEIAKRLIMAIDPTIKVNVIAKKLQTEEAFLEIKKSNYVFGCVDNDLARLILTELCLAFEKPYFDLASDITDDGENYGGRVFVTFDNKGCLYCYGLISPDEVGTSISSPSVKKDREDIYGVSVRYLANTGPSVVSIDGVVSSLAVTEFILMITGLRQTNRYLCYHANLGIVNVNTDNPMPDCYYCKKIRGRAEDANVDRYYKQETT